MMKKRYPFWYLYVFLFVYITFILNSFFLQNKYKCLAYIIYVLILLIINIVGVYNNMIIWKSLNKIERIYDVIGSVVFLVSLILFTKLFVRECILACKVN